MTKKQSQTGKLLRSIFNPRVWMDYDQVRDSTKYLKDGIENIYTLKEKVRGDQSFEEAIREQGIDPDHIELQKKSLLRISLFMVVISIGVFIYAALHLVNKNFHASAASFVIFLVVLSMAFRYHFWYYQLKAKRLGCTVREWFICGVCGAKK